MKQILFFSALCYSLVMASCGGGATEKTSDESTAVQSVSRTVFRNLPTAWRWTVLRELLRWPMHLLLTAS